VAAIHINTSSVRVRFALVRVVSTQVLFLGYPHEQAFSITYLHSVAKRWYNFDVNSHVRHCQQ